MHVDLLVFDGFDLLDVFGPLEPLSAAGCDVALVHREGPRFVTSQQGVRVEATAQLAREGVDGIIVPGGGWLNRAERGAWAEARSGELIAALSELKGSVSWIASVCSGGMLLASARLLAGKRATTNRGCFDDFRPLVGELIDARVVDDGDVITAGALSCGLDLGLHLVDRFVGAETAKNIARSMEYPPPAATAS